MSAGEVRDTPRIWAAMSIYREAELIERAIWSCKDFVDGYLIIDGPFLGARHLPEEGTREIAIRTIADTGKPGRYIEVQGYRETEKRSLFFKEIPEGDYLLNIDGDEVLEFLPGFTAPEVRDWLYLHHARLSPSRIVVSCPLLWVPMAMWNPSLEKMENIPPKPLVIRVSPDIRYHQKHLHLYRGDQLLSDSNYEGASNRSAPMMLPGIRVINYWDSRKDAARRNAWLDYQRMMSGLNWDELRLAPGKDLTQEEPPSAAAAATQRRRPPAASSPPP